VIRGGISERFAENPVEIDDFSYKSRF